MLETLTGTDAACSDRRDTGASPATREVSQQEPDMVGILPTHLWLQDDELTRLHMRLGRLSYATPLRRRRPLPFPQLPQPAGRSQGWIHLLALLVVVVVISFGIGAAGAVAVYAFHPLAMSQLPALVC